MSRFINRSFLTLRDFCHEDILELLKLAADLKAEKKSGKEIQRLERKNIALIFEKDSTRTRIGFEVAAHDQGAHVTYLGPTGTQIGHKESIKDTGRVLGRIYDAIEYRGFSQHNVELLAKYSGVPVYNGLTTEYHPTQVLADLLTMTEHSEKQLREISFCYVGDTSNNVADSLLIGASKLGMDVRLCGPVVYRPTSILSAYAQDEARKSGAQILITDDIAQATAGCDFLYTDVWLSMGEPESSWMQRIHWLLPYQVTAEMMRDTGNRATRFMHCLPAFHDRNTEVGRQIMERFDLNGLEVTDDVFESDASIVFDQAENRLHTIKAVMVATIG